ncbi:phosphatidylserine decarboxylase [Mesobacillus subterraneus]|uniref:Phosphatidylserine decarboxylase proenzyme n=1 Tax=Mesobacillus subterraneus TaxID=285983 RepID=A0A427TJW2_9BACI|nr:phosphatidylserine decarboxylase [Mesobacillus subterraneus]RSD24131.1 phosphatidylserine decarboxylase [Mesobacillus subterraneus]
MIERIYRMLIELTNGRWSSAILHRFAKSERSKVIIPSFAKTYKINQDEMEKPIQEYNSLHEFFIRNLKEGARSIDQDPMSVVSPVDSVIEEIGRIAADKSITVKGKVYSIAEMLGDDEAMARYEEGTYMIFYLSPSHYHQIHSPLNGEVVKQWTLGKKSYPVNKMGLAYGNYPLSKNYRKITEIRHSKGMAAVVKVGAMFVNSIETTHKGEKLEKGEQLAYFTFGSTIVMLFEKDTITLLPEIKPPYHIKYGEPIGTLTGQA